jgi:spectinomycin phosphotransferase
VQQIEKIIATLHSYRDEIPVNTKNIREDFSLPFLNQLKEILHKEFVSSSVDLKDLLGVYIKPLEGSIDRVERLALDIRRSNPNMVLCHTDIHNWNLMQSDEQIVLIDWEGLKLAPAEADLMFFVDKPYYDIFINIYQKLHKDFVINMDTLLFYQIRRKLEDIWEFIEQLLCDKQEEQERNETIKLLMSELNDLVFWRSI